MPAHLAADPEPGFQNVPCVVEGKGTNLFNYKFQLSKRLRIPLDELTYKAVPDDFVGTFLQIEPKSLQNAISVRVSDIKIVSLGEIPMLSHPETDEEEESL